MEAVKYIPTKIDIEITDISLLTVEEAKQLPRSIRRYEDWWWLRSPGECQYHAAYVFRVGTLDVDGYVVSGVSVCVRPAITVSNAIFEIGETIIIQGKKYVAISPNRVLYNDEVVHHRFDMTTNDYDKSEIKKIVDGWLEREEEK